jgi:hypothetical protein
MTDHPPESKRKPTRDYLVEQTAGSILRNSFYIFFHNYPALFLIVFVPVVPFAVMRVHGTHIENDALTTAGTIGLSVATFLTWTAVTVAVGDVCTGYPIRIGRAYHRGFLRVAPRVLGTTIFFAAIVAVFFNALGYAADTLESSSLSSFVVFLVLVAAAIGFGFVATLYLIAFQVTVLEPRWGLSALRRSRELGRGFYWRNLGIIAFSVLVALIPHVLVVTVVYSFLITWLGENRFTDFALVAAMYSMAPLYVVTQVLIYYDMRVRKNLINFSILVSELG